jgi:hypothetical protein
LKSKLLSDFRNIDRYGLKEIEYKEKEIITLKTKTNKTLQYNNTPKHNNKIKGLEEEFKNEDNEYSPNNDYDEDFE